MKNTFRLIPAILFFSVCFHALGLTGLPVSAPSHYVVIGAFSLEKNAVRFVQTAKKQNLNAVSSLNVSRNLHYVFVTQTSDWTAACNEATRIRKSTPFTDTWVFTGTLGEASAAGTDVNPISQQAITPAESRVEKSVVTEKAVEEKPVEKVAEQVPAAQVTTPQQPATVQPAPEKTTNTPVIIEDVKKDTLATAAVLKLPPVADAPKGAKNFYFRLLTALEAIELAGDVDIMDLDRSTRVATYKANQNAVIQPLNKSGKLQLVTEVFGYRPVKLNLDFNKPEETPDLKLVNNQYVVSFALTRLKKGDVEIMYNVYFFKDAGVMRPESRSEVNSLLEMMKDNPKYKIRIHGHTNGNASGKIISMGDSKKFFSLDGTKEGYGSAKKLSEERARVIQEYLKAGGIDPSRTEIKAWGGKKPIHEKNSALARENVRVEIEILEE